jgi:hypothetical protein
VSPRPFLRRRWFQRSDDEIVVGPRLDDLVDDLAGVQFGFVMLLPDFELICKRWTAMGSPFADAFGWIDDEIRLLTRRIGLWLDTTSLTPSETVDAILERLDETIVNE